MWLSPNYSGRLLLCYYQAYDTVDTYDVDELNHGQSELDGDDFAEVLDWSDEWIVAVAVKQRFHESNFISAAQSCTQPRLCC